jgi:hypothetical protein
MRISRNFWNAKCVEDTTALVDKVGGERGPTNLRSRRLTILSECLSIDSKRLNSLVRARLVRIFELLKREVVTI